MRIFKTKTFARFARRARIDDRSLSEAVTRAEIGLIDADLGGGLIKQRIARAGQGRSGGYRTLLAFRTEDLAVFLFGFSKSQMDNVADDELKDLQLIASQWLNDTRKITKDWSAGILIEVKNDD